MTQEAWHKYVELFRKHQYRHGPWSVEIKDFGPYDPGPPSIGSNEYWFHFSDSGCIKLHKYEPLVEEWLELCRGLEAVVTFEEIFDLPPLHEELGLEMLLLNSQDPTRHDQH